MRGKKIFCIVVFWGLFVGHTVLCSESEVGSAIDFTRLKSPIVLRGDSKRAYRDPAGYIGPPVLRLPESGIIFRVETELVINPDGSFNELFGTPPDIELEPADLPKSITKEELLKDEWIKKIIDEM